jgi:hypothetical protein
LLFLSCEINVIFAYGESFVKNTVQNQKKMYNVRMKHFFHCDTERHIKRRKYILWLTLFPLFQVALIIVLIIFVNLRAFHENNYLPAAFRGLSAAAAGGTVLFFAVFFITEKLVKRNARYTFLEIGQKAVVYSRYDGDYYERGKRYATRSLYVIPFAALRRIGFSEKKGRIYLEADEIRLYSDTTERLKYRLGEGLPEFESWWYDENGFETLTALRIPRIFGNSAQMKKLSEIIAEAKRAADDVPKPKPHVHKEPDFIKRRRALEAFKKLQRLN